jgi:hypothetical protein
MSNLLTRFLSKNTAGIVIDYLTDPPPLPYLTQLKNMTLSIYQDTNQYYSYQHHTIIICNNQKSIWESVIIYGKHNHWQVGSFGL